MPETVLVLHTLPPAPYDEGLSVGDRFTPIAETSYSYKVIIGDNLVSLTKKPDEDGDSYANWFSIEGGNE